MKTLFLFLFTAVVCFSTLSSQPVKYAFTHIGPSEGLADNVVNHILQDKQGFMWFATNNGVQRYDGNRFKNYRFDFNSKNSLPGDIALKLLEDDKGNIWIACNNGVAMINSMRSKVERIPFEIADKNFFLQVTQFFQDSKKNIWLVTRNFGALWWDAKTGKFSASEKILPAFTWKTTTMIEEPGTGNYWLGSDSGLAYCDTKRRETYNYTYNPLKLPLLANPKFYNVSICDLIIDTFRNRIMLNTFWSGYPKTAVIRYEKFLYNLTTRSFSTYNVPGIANHRYAIDSRRNMWLLTDGIYTSNLDDDFIQLESMKDDPFGLKADVVHALYEDQKHNRWIGTDNGIYIFNVEETRISRGFGFDAQLKPLYVTVEQFLELPGGKIWMATWGNGIYEYASDFTPVKQYNFSNNADVNYNMVWCMRRTENGKVWIGCQAGRIMIFDPVTGRFEKLADPAFDMRTVRSIAEDQQSNIWFGTQHGLIVKYDSKRNIFTRYSEPTYPVKESYGNINKLYVDRKNNLWACTSAAGLLNINVSSGAVTERYQNVPGDLTTLSGNATTSILEYNDSLMIVSAVGINIFNTTTKKFSYITTRDGLPSNNISGIQLDKIGNVWAGLNGGLVRISMPSKKIEVFQQTDGIINDAFQSNAMQLLADGRVVAGTTKDFIFFDPKDFISTQAPPDIRITSIRVLEQELNFDSILMQHEKVRLAPNENFITISFSPLTYLGNKFSYYYKLEGLDKDWIKTTDLSASYTHLSGGNYTFLVKAENADGVPSKNIAALKLYVRPPFYETIWFFLLLAASMAGILYFLHRVRVNRILDLEKVRGRIARDLHDDMGSTLSTINILSEMAQMKIERDTKVTKDYIAKISDNSHRMMEAMDDIVWSINPMNDNMQKITARMREYATSLLEAKDIAYTFQVDEAINRIKLDMESRRDFFLIFKEAVNNLVKYSKCSHASIKIETYDYSMVLKIQDDGVGFNVDEADSGNGLSNMQKRAKSLNSKLVIDSQPGVGTKIMLEVIFA